MMARLRGSALITTVIITGSVGLVMAGVVRFAVVQLRTASGLEEGIIAYAAAEAGIEEGLLRWRYDRNIELPLANTQEVMPDTPARRVNLTAGTVPETVQAGAPLPPVNDSVYDLRIWYKAQTIGDKAQLADANYPYRIFKDQTTDIDVSNLRGEILQFDFALPTGYEARVEARLVVESGCNPIGAVTPDLCEISKQLSDVSTHGTLVIPIPAGLDQTPYRVRIKPFIFPTSSTSTAPATTYITYALRPTVSATSLIDSGITVIESTGYFGNAKRKLLAKIDRRSGTVLGIYDYALFSLEQLGN